MVRNLYFFLIINTFASYLFTMNPSTDLETLYKGWVKVLDENETESEDLSCILTRSGVELKNISALSYAIKHGGPPKIIKKLAPLESREVMLHQARLKFIKNRGKEYALEEAIQVDNLNFVKTVLAQQELKLKFRAQVFGIALLYRKNKTAKYMYSTTPKLFSKKTIRIINAFLGKAISDRSLLSVEIAMNNFIIPLNYQLDILNYSLEECKKNEFEDGYLYLVRVQQALIAKKPLLLLNNTL